MKKIKINKNKLNPERIDQLIEDIEEYVNRLGVIAEGAVYSAKKEDATESFKNHCHTRHITLMSQYDYLAKKLEDISELKSGEDYYAEQRAERAK